MTRTRKLDLILFATRPAKIRQALDGGITAMIVDWEWREKERRQRGVDTEINRDTPADLKRLASMRVPRRLCRLNQFGDWTQEELETAISCGATDLFLPMVETTGEVEQLLGFVDDRCAVGILVETPAAVRQARDLANLPLDFVYVGLNDLAISRGSACIFDALIDGTVESVRAAFPDIPFGFGGVTVVDGGNPIPCRLLLSEMAALRCSFSFLRRSFKRDTRGKNLAGEIARIGSLWDELNRRSQVEISNDRRRLESSIQAARAGHIK